MNENRMRAAVAEQIMGLYEKLYRLALSYVKNEQTAMDVVQESAYKALAASDKINAEEFIKTWVYRITINTAIDAVRKAKREAEGIDAYLAEVQTVVNDDVQREHAHLEVMELLGALEERDRAVVILRFFEDMKLSEIAAVTMENENTVKTRLYRALKKMRIQLGNSFDTSEERMVSI